MKWTERVMAAREAGSFTAKDVADSGNPSLCLVGEAAELLGETYTTVHLRLYPLVPGAYLEDNPKLPILGGTFPRLVKDNEFDEAEQLCLAVEDAILRLKREADGIERLDRNGWDEV